MKHETPLSIEWLIAHGFELQKYDDPLAEPDEPDGYYYLTIIDDPDENSEALLLITADRTDKVELILFPYDTIRFDTVEEVRQIYKLLTRTDIEIEAMLVEANF